MVPHLVKRSDVLTAYIKIWHHLDEISNAGGSYSAGAIDAYTQSLSILRNLLV